MPLEVAAGGAVFFCYGTAHCTRANTTKRERAGMAFHFLRTECIDQARLRGSSRHPILSGPGALDGSAEHSVQVAGTWEREVERVLETATP